MTALSENERSLMAHVMLFGSDGYPIRKTSGGRWIVGRDDGTASFPTVFKTKREAVERFEAWMDIKRDQLAGRI